MKWLNQLALFCIIFGTVLFISLVIFNHIIGGNADGGYRKEGVYRVYSSVKIHMVRKLCIYTNRSILFFLRLYFCRIFLSNVYLHTDMEKIKSAKTGRINFIG